MTDLEILQEIEEAVSHLSDMDDREYMEDLLDDLYGRIDAELEDMRRAGDVNADE